MNTTNPSSGNTSSGSTSSGLPVSVPYTGSKSASGAQSGQEKDSGTSRYAGGTESRGGSWNEGQNDSSPEKHREGPVARAIEEETAKIPSDTFLWAAGGSIALSLALQVFGSKQTSNFVGQWAPTILILGLYNKLVKLEGHDRTDRGGRARPTR